MKSNPGFMLVLFLLITTSCLQAQNSISIDLEDFTSLSVSGRLDVELIPSDSKEMTISSSNGKPEEVNVEVKDGELKIRIRPRFDKDEIISIRIPYKSLTKIESLAGAVINSARDLEAVDLELNAATGGKIELSVSAVDITAKITQVSDIILYGKAVSQTVSVNTGGNYLAYDMLCQDSYIKVSSGSQAKVTASRKIEASASTKGFIGYIGDPVSTYVKTSLGGEILSYKKKPENNDY